MITRGEGVWCHKAKPKTYANKKVKICRDGMLKVAPSIHLFHTTVRQHP